MPMIDEIYEFLEEMSNRTIPTFAYKVASDIENVLRKQWAGLFQRLLRAHTRSKPTTPALETCPAFLRLQQLLDAQEPIRFSSLGDLTEQLHRFGFKPSVVLPSDSAYEWAKYDSGIQNVLFVSKELFDEEERHLPIVSEKWKDRFIRLKQWENEHRNE